jgi:hypothetical protein
MKSLFTLALVALVALAGESQAQFGCATCASPGGSCGVVRYAPACGVQYAAPVYSYSGVPRVGQYIWVPEVRQWCQVTAVGPATTTGSAPVRKMPEPEPKPKAPRSDQ